MNEDMKKLAKYLAKKIDEAKEEILDVVESQNDFEPDLDDGEDEDLDVGYDDEEDTDELDEEETKLVKKPKLKVKEDVKPEDS